MDSVRLREVTLALWSDRSVKLTAKLVSQATGIPKDWLDHIRVYRSLDVDRVQTLYEYLSGRKLIEGAAPPASRKTPDEILNDFIRGA